MKKIFAMFALTLAASFAQAHANHSDNICSTQIQGLCVHMGYENIVVNQPAEFMVHFTPASNLDSALITDVQVDLWMQMGGHGHGSAPVAVRQLDAVHYQVSEAYFLMPGTWQVRVNLNYQGVAQQLIIPVAVAK